MGTRRITTPIFRMSYQNILEPKETDSGAWVYQLSMIFEPDANLDDLKAIFNEAIKEKWGADIPKTGVISPFRRGEWKSEKYLRGFDLDKNPEYEGKIIVAASSYTKLLSNGQFDLSKKPGIVGPDPKAIFIADTTNIYSGMYARAEISAYVPKKRPNTEDRVVFGLHNVQKCYDGDPLGGGSNGDPTKAFGTFVPPEGAGNHNDLLGV